MHRGLLVALTVAASACILPIDVGWNDAPTTTTGTAGGGGALLCVPGTTKPCYDGPEGTDGQGTCRAGTQVCATDGQSFGACSGQVLPNVEDCATAADEDCDGLAPPCKGNLLWAEQFGGTGEETSHGIATDAMGNVFVVGEMEGSVDFGGGLLTSAGGRDGFVVKLDPNGAHLWSRRFGGGGDDAAMAVAVNATGEVLITGNMMGTVDFGGGPLTSAGDQDIFVVKLDPAGGHVWSERFGDLSDQFGNGIAVDPGGNVIVGGSFAVAVDFGGGVLTGAGSLDVFVAKLDPSGAHVWSERFGDAGDQLLTSVAAAPDGGVALAGYFNGSPDFGGGALVVDGNTDAFVARLDMTGAHVWSRRLGGAADELCAGLAVDATGGVLMTGFSTGTVDFGGGPLTSAGGLDIFVTKLDANGDHAWSTRFGDPGSQTGAAIATDSAGNALVTGYITGQVDFGGGLLPSVGGDDVFVVKLDATTGTHVWSRRFGGAQNEAGQAIAVDPGGNALIAGYLSGAVSFGGGFDLMSAGGTDIFVAKFAP